MNRPIYSKIITAKALNKKCFALLIDPDKVNKTMLLELIDRSVKAKVDYFFVGGSLIIKDNLNDCLNTIKDHCEIPTILFPGSTLHVDNVADAVLFLSLISGRNADLLIGKHVEAAPLLKHSGLDILSTGYMLVDGGRQTTVSYISNTTPLPADKEDIAVCTAMAGEMIGMQLIFMDAGSGAMNPISTSMIKAVQKSINAPLIIGGGIRTTEAAFEAAKAGADIVVVGNAIEKDAHLIEDIAAAIHSCSVPQL